MNWKLVFCLTLLFAALIPSSVFAAYDGNSGPFAIGHENGVEVPRMYSSVITLNADSASATKFVFRTENTSTDGDPVMLLINADTGAPIKIEDDDVYMQFVPIGTSRPRDPKLDIDLSAGESLNVRVVVASFDEDYSGQTDVVVTEEFGGLAPQEYFHVDNVRFGSITINASWQSGDIVQTVGHYESRTLMEACEEELGGDWHYYRRECDANGVSYGPAITCEQAYPNQPLRYNAVYPHGSRCESTTFAKDTMMFASNGWSKAPEIVGVWDPALGSYVFVYQARSQSTNNGGFDEDSGSGTNSKLVMPAASGSYSAIVVGLHPWNDRYSGRPSNELSAPVSPVTSDKLRIYRDHAHDMS